MVTEAHAGKLRREVGLIGLTFFSLAAPSFALRLRRLT
jgi:hypothetical protein